MWDSSNANCLVTTQPGARTSFAGSDSILEMTSSTVIRQGQRMIPVFAAAIGLVYNLPFDGLVLTREAVNLIFIGQVVSWSDPLIRQSNPGLNLSDVQIVRVVRADKSGTTQAFARTLASFANTDHRPSYWSQHPLGGSSLPAWPPANATLLLRGTRCVLQYCARSICAPGSYLEPESDACLPCPRGTYADTRGQGTQCSPCAAGYYSSSEGSALCSKCNDATYQNDTGRTACRACPANTRRFFLTTRTDVGNGSVASRHESSGTTADDCKCLPGFWLPSSMTNASQPHHRRGGAVDTSVDLTAGRVSDRGGEACVPCPDGATCAGFVNNLQAIPVTTAGYWGDPAHPTVFYECKTPTTCASNYYCGAGHMGRMCAEPLTGYFTVGHLWYIKCPAAAGASAALTVFLTIGVVWLWLRIMNLAEGSVYDSFDVGIKFLHLVGFVAQFPLRWHPNLNGIILVLLVANLEVDFISPHCIWPSFNGVTLFYFQLFVPFVIVACSTLHWALVGVLRGRDEKHEASMRDPLLNRMFVRDGTVEVFSWRTYVINKSIQVFGFMYQVLAYRGLSCFSCRYHPSGNFLRFFPDVACGSGTHAVMMTVAVLYFVLILLALPLLMLWVLLKGRSENTLFEPKFSQRYGTFYEQFKVEYVWWELVYLARKLCISMILALVDVPMIQGALTVLLIYVCIIAHLSSQPFVEWRNNALETACLFCALAFVVCGIIFYPSLDSSVNCIGTNGLDNEFAELCSNSISIKQSFSLALIFLIVATFVLTVLSTLYEIYERRLASAACRSIECVQPWFGKEDKSEFKRTHRPVSIRKGRIPGLVNSPRRGRSASFQQASRGSSSPTPILTETSSVSEIGDQTINDGGTQSPVSGAHLRDSLRLHLSHMLVGSRMWSWRAWLKEMEKREENIKAKYKVGGGGSGFSAQELAYLKLDSLLPASSCRFAASLGNGSNSTLSAVSRVLMEVFPGLIDYMATADDTARSGIFAFLQDYLAFLNVRPVFEGGSGRDIIVNQDYASLIAHWLMHCDTKDLVAYHKTVDDLAATAGMDLKRQASARRSSAYETLMQIRRANADGVTAAVSIGTRRGSVASQTLLSMQECNLDSKMDPWPSVKGGSGYREQIENASVEQRGLSAAFVELVAAEIPSALDTDLFLQRQSSTCEPDVDCISDSAGGGVFSDRTKPQLRESSWPKDRASYNSGPAAFFPEADSSSIMRCKTSLSKSQEFQHSSQNGPPLQPFCGEETDLCSDPISQRQQSPNVHNLSNNALEQASSLRPTEVLLQIDSETKVPSKAPAPESRSATSHQSPEMQSKVTRRSDDGNEISGLASNVSYLQDIQGGQLWECCSPRRLQAVMAAGQAATASPRKPGAGPGGQPADVWAWHQPFADHSEHPQHRSIPGLRPIPRPSLVSPRKPGAKAGNTRDNASDSELDRAWMSMNERLRATWRAMSPQ